MRDVEQRQSRSSPGLVGGSENLAQWALFTVSMVLHGLYSVEWSNYSIGAAAYYLLDACAGQTVLPRIIYP